MSQANERRTGSVSIQGAADILDCHPDTVRRLIKAKKLEAYKVGRDWRILKSALREFIKARSNLAAPAA